MKNISNRLLNNPDFGVYRNRPAVTVLDDTSTTLPMSSSSKLVLDSTTLTRNDRVLFINLNSSDNNKIFSVVFSEGQYSLSLAVDGDSASGVPQNGEVVFVRAGSHAGEVWSFDKGIWDVIDLVELDTSGNLSTTNLVLRGSDDPSVVAKTAEIGTLWIRTVLPGGVYQKLGS